MTGFRLFLEDIDNFDMSGYGFLTIDYFYPYFALQTDFPTILKYLCFLFCAKMYLNSFKSKPAVYHKNELMFIKEIISSWTEYNTKVQN